MANLYAAGGGQFVRLFKLGIIAVNGSGRVAEAILHAESDAASLVILELGQAHKHIGIFVSVVKIDRGKNVSTATCFQARIFLPFTQRIGVFKLNIRRGIQQRTNVPAGIEEILFEGPTRGPGTFHETNSFRSGAAHQVRRGTHQFRICVMRKAQCLSFETKPWAAGEIELDGNGLIPDDAFQAANLVEHRCEGSVQVFVIGRNLSDGDGQSCGGSGKKLGKRKCSGGRQQFATSHQLSVTPARVVGWLTLY